MAKRTRLAELANDLPKEIIATIFEYLPIMNIVRNEIYLTSKTFYSSFKIFEGILDRKPVLKWNGPRRYYTILSMKQHPKGIDLKKSYCHICIVTGKRLEHLAYCHSCKQRFCRCHFVRLKCACRFDQLKCSIRSKTLFNRCNQCGVAKCIECTHNCPICKKGVCNDNCSKKLSVYKRRICYKCYKRIRNDFT